MHIFLDTSALAKRYIYEKGTEKVNEIFVQATTVSVSILCLPEIFSALARRRREKKINLKEYSQIKQFIVKDFQDFSVCELTPRIISEAIILLEKHSLRTMDALHLACSLEIKPDIFISSDEKQIFAAKKINLKVLDV